MLRCIVSRLQHDEQYISILTKCGAQVLSLLALPPDTSAEKLTEEVERQLKDMRPGEGVSGEGVSARSRTCSIFFEESKSPSAKV